MAVLVPNCPGGHEPLFAEELNIGANTFFPQGCREFIKFMLSEEAHELCDGPKFLWPIPVRQSTMIRKHPGEAGARLAPAEGFAPHLR